jgi:hypothetical protein
MYVCLYTISYTCMVLLRHVVEYVYFDYIIPSTHNKWCRKTLLLYTNFMHNFVCVVTIWYNKTRHN